MKDIQIGGIVSFTTIDYPGKLAAVLFLVGCPLRCVYCSNRHLQNIADGEYDPQKVLDWLQTRVGKLEAVVFSGGEALMQGQPVVDFMQRVKNMGFFIGLHTCGFYPDLLEKVSGLVDWVGLDFKAIKSQYQLLTGSGVAYDLMLKSLSLWQKTGKPCEVRTTCDPRYVSKADLLEIAKKVSEYGVKNFAVQKYIPHFDEGENISSQQAREQFFHDKEYRKQIETFFESVIWRE